MKPIKFNSAQPKQWFDNKTQKFKYSLPKGDEYMDLLTIDENYSRVNPADKSSQQWVQLFNTGKRVINDTLDYNNWNNIVVIDLDSKKYNIKFDFEQFRNGLIDALLYYVQTNNLYAWQTSWSGNSLHLFFYYNVECSEENFNKCCEYSISLVKDAARICGEQFEKIVNYPEVIDDCIKSPVQGIYISKNKIEYGNLNDKWFGTIDLDSVEIEERKITEIDYDFNSNKKYHIKDNIKPFGNYDYPTRWRISYIIFKYFEFDYKKSFDCWKKIVPIVLAHRDDYDEKTLNEQFNRDYRSCQGKEYGLNSKLVKWCIENLGFKIQIKKKFKPEILNLYDDDITYKLSKDQYISDIDIKFDNDRINHIYAGCGFGKTYWAKQLGKNNRVLFISPLTSINKDSFSDENNWLVIDNNEIDVAKHICGNVKNAINSSWNICTTWESFVAYEMYNYQFDYIIVDEIHTLFMYDYRLTSISNMKKYLPKCSGIKIIMTGTPSLEIDEFDCYKIKIEKEQNKVPAEILFYNESYIGYVYKDIKEWIVDDDHIVIIFKDTANYKDENNLLCEGLTCDLFNSNYKETVEWILDNNTVKEQINIFSVYGQAGINLYINTDKKIRLYILNKNGLGIIQYANRIRNKEIIDKVVVPFKNDNISDNVNKIKIDKDEEIKAAEERILQLNKTMRDFDIFNEKTKSIIKLRYGFTTECLNIFNGKYELNIPNFTTLKQIEAVSDYESQIQMIYNRLVQNDFNVNFNYLQEDIKTNKQTKIRNNVFSGQIVNFDFSQLKTTLGNHLWIDANEKLLKVCTGNLLEMLSYIFNSLFKEYNDIEEVKNVWNNICLKIISKKGSVTKKDIENIQSLYYLLNNWDKIYNKNIISAMQYDNWDDIKLATVYMRNVYNNSNPLSEKSLFDLADETYSKIKNLHSMFDMYRDIILNLQTDDDFNVENDEITQKIYNYLYKEHHQGIKGRSKEVVINGIKYKSIKEASAKLGISRQSIYKKLKE